MALVLNSLEIDLIGVLTMKKLGCNPIMVQLPLMTNNAFKGIIDVINLIEYKWNVDPLKEGLDFVQKNLLSHKVFEEKLDQAYEQREKLIELLADLDEKFAEIVLSTHDISNIDSIDIINSLRRAVVKNQIVPVFLGSSYKNVGVQPLMDSVLKYLPSPLERTYPLAKYYQDELFASVFKVIYIKNLGALTFIRIYSGILKAGEKVHNINRNTSEKVMKLYVPYADEFKEIEFSCTGNIVAVSGLTSTVTSDTITRSKSTAVQVTNDKLT